MPRRIEPNGMDMEDLERSDGPKNASSLYGLFSDPTASPMSEDRRNDLSSFQRFNLIILEDSPTGNNYRETSLQLEEP